MKTKSILVTASNNEEFLDFVTNYLKSFKIEYVVFYNSERNEYDIYITKDVTNRTKTDYEIIRIFTIETLKDLDDKLIELVRSVRGELGYDH